MRTLFILPFYPGFSRSHSYDRNRAYISALAAEGEVDLFPVSSSSAASTGETYYCDKELIEEIRREVASLAPLPIGLVFPAQELTPSANLGSPLVPALRAKSYDLIIVQRFYYFDRFWRLIRRHHPGAHLAIDCDEVFFSKVRANQMHLSGLNFLIDSRHRRRQIDAAHQHRLAQMQQQANEVEEFELGMYRRADTIITPDAGSAELLSQKLFRPKNEILTWPSKLSAYNKNETALPRSGAVAIGDFRDEADANVVLFLKHNLAPLLEENFLIRVGGIYPSEEVSTVDTFGIAAHKFRCEFGAEKHQRLLSESSTIFAPIFFGWSGLNSLLAGIKHGCVPLTNALGAELLGLESEVSCLVGSDAESYRAQIQRIQSESGLRERIVASAQKTLLRPNGPTTATREVEQLRNRVRVHISQETPRPALNRKPDRKTRVEFSSSKKNPALLGSRALPQLLGDDQALS